MKALREKKETKRKKIDKFHGLYFLRIKKLFIKRFHSESKKGKP